VSADSGKLRFASSETPPSSVMSVVHRFILMASPAVCDVKQHYCLRLHMHMASLSAQSVGERDCRGRRPARRTGTYSQGWTPSSHFGLMQCSLDGIHY